MSINLTLARAFVSPMDAMRKLADDCEKLGITAFDVYGDFGAKPEASWLRRFEGEVAAHLGKEDAVFMPSGVMAQQIALCIHRSSSSNSKSNSVSASHFLVHHSSHLLIHEKEGYDHLLGMTPLTAPPDVSAEEQPPLRAKDVEAVISSTSIVPSTIVVEVPHREVGGKCTSWQDLVAIATLRTEKGCKLHMDGARLWEAGGSDAYDGHSLQQLTSLFDSVYVSFYKGLGGLSGAMLLGDAAFCDQARVWLRRFGGNLYTLLPYAVSAWAGFRENKDAFAARRQRMQQVAKLLTAAFCDPASPTAALHPASSLPLLRFDPPVPQVSLVHVYLRCSPQQATAACDAAEAESGVRVFSRIRGTGMAGTPAAAQSYFEFNMGPLNAAVGDEVWVKGWGAFLAKLKAALQLQEA